MGAPGIDFLPQLPRLLAESCCVLDYKLSVELLCEKAPPFIEVCERWGNYPGPLLLLTREERWLVPVSCSNLERTYFGFDVVSLRFELVLSAFLTIYSLKSKLSN